MSGTHAKAERFLRTTDPQLRRIIDLIGPCGLRPTGGRFEVLARSIVSQQISTSAARTIFRRLKSLMPGGRISANGLIAVSDDQLQAAGLSKQKRTYLRDLCQHVQAGTVSFRRLPRLSDQGVIEELVQVKGIGVWTAQMFLLAGLGRPDVFAPADLGLQNAMIRIYSIDRSINDMEQIAAAWSPWRSVASWYLWRSLDVDL